MTLTLSTAPTPLSTPPLPDADPAALPALACVTRLSLALEQAMTLPDLTRERRLRTALAEFLASTDLDQLLQRCGTPAAHGYRRHLLGADAQGRFSIVAIVWGAQQFSPVHGHHTWCAYGVLSGALSENHFDWCETTQSAQASRVLPRLPGDISYTEAGLCGIHQLGNPHLAPAVSLHLYGVAGAQVSTHVNRLITADSPT